MKQLEQILRAQAVERPEMEPRDAVKLIYQNEFGGGHMIPDEEACMAYLRREYETVARDPAAVRAEPIGNGLVRVNLAAVDPWELEDLGRAFIRSAASRRGSMEAFLEKLKLLERLTGEGIFAFDGDDLQHYLTDYREKGYPAVSHSERYRKAYRPAYRVVED